MPRALTAGVLGALVGAALVLFIEPGEIFGRARPPVGDVSVGPNQTAVVDGETLRMRDMVIRLLGVAAPSRGQLCHHMDGSAFDCGAASAEALAHLVKERAVECRLHGHDPNGRLIAVCRADGRELNEAQVLGGWARARVEAPNGGAVRFSGASFRAGESEARTEHRGLWAGRFDPQT
jgi:endonuclease YncB( thermonuclease family)